MVIDQNGSKRIEPKRSLTVAVKDCLVTESAIICPAAAQARQPKDRTLEMPAFR